MAFRTFAVMKNQSTTVPQPLIGSWITAGLTVPANGPVTITLGTQCSAGNDATEIFRGGDTALLIDPDGTHIEEVFVASVLNNTLTIGVQNETGVATRLAHISGAFGTGTFISLRQMANGLYIQPQDGNSAVWYLGTAWNMTALFRRIAKLQNVASGAQPVDFGSSMGFFGNPYDSSELWTLGTANDLYNASLTVI